MPIDNIYLLQLLSFIKVASGLMATLKYCVIVFLLFFFLTEVSFFYLIDVAIAAPARSLLLFYFVIFIRLEILQGDDSIKFDIWRDGCIFFNLWRHIRLDIASYVPDTHDCNSSRNEVILFGRGLIIILSGRNKTELKLGLVRLYNFNIIIFENHITRYNKKKYFYVTLY